MKLIDLLFPPACLGCGELCGSEEYLCFVCLEKYLTEKNGFCDKCQQRFSLCCCTISGNASVRYLSAYTPDIDAITRKMILSAKERPDARLEIFLSREIATLIKLSQISLEGAIITNIPRRTLVKLTTGTDQSEKYARGAAKILGLPYVRLLKNTAVSAQKDLTTEERRDNIDNGLMLRKNVVIPQKIVLIDDVVTTGSSFAKAVELFDGAYVACFAISKTI